MNPLGGSESKASPGVCSRKKRIVILIPVLVIISVFFLPLEWDLALPGETRYETQDRLIARENGFLRFSPGETSRRYLKGETIFFLHDPILFFARSRLQCLLNYDRILFEQQRVSRATVGDSILTGRKIDSDLHALREVNRKIDSGIKTAPGLLTFIPAIGREGVNAYIRSGTVLGLLCSGPLTVRAYADDQDIKFIKVGQRVRMLTRDQLSGCSGTVSRVSPIPVYLHDSPALQSLGGEIPANIDENDPELTRSLHPVYAVDIVPSKPLSWQCGRFIRAEIAHRRVLAFRIGELLLSAFRREI